MFCYALTQPPGGRFPLHNPYGEEMDMALASLLLPTATTIVLPGIIVVIIVILLLLWLL
jgi:hypothetical protein